MNKFKSFETKNELNEELSSNIIQVLKEAIKKNKRASLLLSGGNTPKAFFKVLSNKNLAWEKVVVSLVDDRWLETNHKHSNELLVKENLLQNKALKAKFVGMYIDGKTAFESDKLCSQKYQDEVFPFDIIILGMGDDFHTASLFPENQRLDEAYNLENKNLCISIRPTTASYDRMSLTLQAILSAKNIILHIEGKKKLKAYEEALKSKDFYKTPISAILNNKTTDIEVYYA